MVGVNQVDDTPEQQRRTAVLKALAVSPDEPKAWHDLYMLYWPQVVATIYTQVGGNRDQAQDLSQDLFLRIAKYVDFRSFDNRVHFERYLRSMCRNLVSQTLRQSKHLSSWDQTTHSEAVLATAKPSPSVQLAHFLDEINPVYEKLAPKEQKLFDLLASETSKNEIATRLNISARHVAVRIYRLRLKLKQLIARQNDVTTNPSEKGRKLSPDTNTS